MKNMFIKNANLYTGEKHVEDACILIENGKIKDFGKDIKNASKYDEVDAQGKFVTPGFIDAHTHLGMWESGIGFEGADGNEITDPVTPELRSIDAFNPLDETFENARMGGITTVATGPGSANVLGGQYSCIKTAGRVADDMIVSAYIGAKCAFGENPKRCYGTEKKNPQTRMAIASILRNTLYSAKEYLEKKNSATKTSEKPAYNAKYEALIPVLEKKLPLKAHCHRADDIATAIRIAKEFDILLTLDHVTEGHIIPEHIKKSGYNCIVGPSFGEKSKFELKEKTYFTAKRLIDEGVLVAIMTDHPVIPIQDLGMCVGFVMEEGLSFDEAIKTVTINPAKILGIDDTVGSIEKGKNADIVIWEKEPFTLAAYANTTIIDGEIVYKKYESK